MYTRSFRIPSPDSVIHPRTAAVIAMARIPWTLYIDSQTKSRETVTCPLYHTAPSKDTSRVVRRKKTALNKKWVQEPLYIFHIR